MFLKQYVIGYSNSIPRLTSLDELAELRACVPHLIFCLFQQLVQPLLHQTLPLKLLFLVHVSPVVHPDLYLPG